VGSPSNPSPKLLVRFDDSADVGGAREAPRGRAGDRWRSLWRVPAAVRASVVHVPCDRRGHDRRVRHRLVMFDGVPGSGKTTTSRAIADRLQAAGEDCGWAREEDPWHPFFGREVRRQHDRVDYGDICLQRWKKVTESCASQTWARDGCALQSTVRFMFEQARTATAIESYWQRFNETVDAAEPRLVYFHHRDVEQFLRTHTVRVRSDVWHNICAHVVGTPIGRLLEGEEVDTPIEFWVRYASLCDHLVGHSAIPVLNVDIEHGWASAEPLTLNWLGLAHAGAL
jgi:hypothetical protein